MKSGFAIYEISKFLMGIIAAFMLASCDTPTEISKARDQKYTAADSVDLNSNYSNCLLGFTVCKKELLSQDQRQLVSLKEAERNFIWCVNKYSYCNSELLTEDQKELLGLTVTTSPLDVPFFTGLCAENGSCYGDISSLTGRPKTVQVGGYFRQDGTYVRGYYRSK